MTRPNPWQASQAPSGELYENSAGSGGRSVVPQPLHEKPSSKRSWRLADPRLGAPLAERERGGQRLDEPAALAAVRSRHDAIDEHADLLADGEQPLVAGAHQLVDAEPASGWRRGRARRRRAASTRSAAAEAVSCTTSASHSGQCISPTRANKRRR